MPPKPNREVKPYRPGSGEDSDRDGMGTIKVDFRLTGSWKIRVALIVAIGTAVLPRIIEWVSTWWAR